MAVIVRHIHKLSFAILAGRYNSIRMAKKEVEMAWNKPVFESGKADCRTIIQQLIKNPLAQFQDFVAIWNEMNFEKIFHLHRNMAELYQFTEELLKTAKDFCLPPQPFPVRRGAVYLLYSLYYTQITETGDNVPSVKIRVSSDEWVQISKLIELCQKEGYFDAVQLMSKMYSEGAFHVVATAHVPYMGNKRLKYLQKPLPTIFENEVEPLVESDLIEILKKCTLRCNESTGPVVSQIFK